MKMPAVRLPSMSLPSDWVEGLLGRRTLLYAVYTGVLFLVFLLVNFPYKGIVQRAIQTADLQSRGLRLEIGDTRFAWWRGYELQGVRLGPADPSLPPFIDVPSLFVRPGLDGLVRGQINSLDLLGLMYGGEVDARLTGGGGVSRAIVTVNGLLLQRYPAALSFLQLQEGALAGKLSGVITIESHGGDGGDGGDTRAVADLNLDHASISAAKLQNGISLPTLHFDKAALKANLQGGRVEVQEFDATGPELKLSASGQIALREPVEDSVLNLKFSAVPGEESPEEIQTLLTFLPPPPRGGKPDAPRTISGTLARPRIR
jgi:type II secretion system protein N